MNITDAGFLTVAEAAEHLKLSRSAVYQLMDRGELPYAKFGRARRIPKLALASFAEQAMRGRWSDNRNRSAGVDCKTNGNNDL